MKNRHGVEEIPTDAEERRGRYEQAGLAGECAYRGGDDCFYLIEGAR